MVQKGFINIRQITKGSLGFTIPHKLIKEMGISEGQYLYKATKQRVNGKDVINLVLKQVDETI
jgi:hypothetical protein